ncbi:MAG: response regulator [Variovorax sp.]|jgi:two-component system response regulator BaeR|nr:MAG: response regulator [Variovorax sp.]
MSHILLVEDEQDIASVLRDYLHHAGHEVEHIDHGTTALARALARPPDLMLLDVMLPGTGGIEILRAIRARSALPVIMLTARVEEVDRLIGLELGADDYICKPFSPREVVARVKSVLRRSGGAGGNGNDGRSAATVAAGGSLLLDDGQWRVTLQGASLALTRREFRLLEVLARQPGRIFSRTQLLELAYDDALDVNERAIDSHVKNLRRKLAAAAPGHDWIRSVYGIGFAFEDVDTRA